MKKLKKPLSILLSAILAFSACAVGVSALAEEQPRDLASPEKIQTAILEDFKDETGKDNTSAKLKDDVKEAYAKLSAEQKDTISAAATTRVFRMSYNTATGSGAAKVEASVQALGGYTDKQNQVINYAMQFAAYAPWIVDGKEYKVNISSFPFDKDYKTGGVTYTPQLQAEIMQVAIDTYHNLATTGDMLELADSVYAYSSYQYFYGCVYFAASTKMLVAMGKYLPVANPGASSDEIVAMLAPQLGLTEGGAYDLLGTIKQYTATELTQALETYNSSDKGADAVAAYKAVVKDLYDASKVYYTLPYQVIATSANIVSVGGKLTTVSSVWNPIKNEYEAIINKEAVDAVIAEMKNVDMATLTNSADVQAAFVQAGFPNLDYSQKNLLQANAEAKAIYDSWIKIAYDADTLAFRTAVNNYRIPNEITDANKDEVQKQIKAFTTMYDGLKSDLKAVSSSKSILQNYIKNNYAAVQTKYDNILNLNYEINLKDFAAKVSAFKLDAESSEALNASIEEIRAMYKGLDSKTVAYLKSNKASVYETYNKILAKWFVLPGEADNHELFDPEVVAAEMTAPLKDVMYNTVVPKIAGLINTVLPVLLPGATDIKTAVDTLFTNENATLIMKEFNKLIYGALSGMEPVMGMPVPTLFALTPFKVADILPDQYAAVKAVLATYGDTLEAWDQIPADLDWGITPGNYEEFITAMLYGMNGLTVSLGGILIGGILQKAVVGESKKLPDNSGIDPSTFVPGGWDYLIIPLLECLNVPQDKIPTNLEYANGVAANGVTMVSVLKPLIDTLYYQVLPQVSADPADYLLSVLPNLAYHIEDGCIVDGVNKFLNNANASLLGNVVDLKPMVMDLFKDADGNVPDALTLDMIWNMISPMLAGAGLDISLADILKVGHLGTPERVSTVRVGVESTVKVTADKDSVLNYLFNAVNGLLENLGVDFTVKTDFVKEEAPKYPHNGKMGKDVMKAMINGLDSLIGGFINIGDAINNGLCTQEMAANAITGIYSAINNLLGSEIVSPSTVAGFLSEAKYADLKEALTFANPADDVWANVGLVIKNGDKVVSQTNMGFKDGDRQGFVECLTAGLRPLAGAIGETGLLINTTATDGSTAYGLYETLIIPTFEALGLTPATDSATYTANYNKLAKKADPATAYDYQIQTILAPVLDLLDDVAAAPVATLMKLLPNLAYAIQYNPQLAFIGNLLDANGGLNGILNGLIQGIATGEDADGNAVYGLKNLELPTLPLDALASSGTVKELKSKSALHKTYANVVADEADAFVNLFYYLYDAMNYKDNMQTVKTLLSNIEGMDSTISSLIDNVLNEVFTKGKEEALCMLGTLLASDVWECPNGEGNDGSGTPSTGDYAVPAGVFFLMMMSAGGAILLLKKKKTTSAE